MSDREPNSNRLLPSVGFVVTLVCIVPAVWSVAVSSFVRCRSHSTQHVCINNLRQIRSGKEQAAMARNWTNGVDCDIPSNAAVVNSYIKGNTFPECPVGKCRYCDRRDRPWWRGRPEPGKYTYGVIGENPTCSFSGRTIHKLKDG